MKRSEFDWNQARAFLATAQEGSLSAAARSLGQTQPTLGRQVAALEEDLGVTLFERVGRALVLTETGHELLKHVKAMGEAADRLNIAASGKAEDIDGEVRISATDLVSVHILPAAIRKIQAAAPKLRVEIVAVNEISDLLRREADIAIRHLRPEQPDLVARLVSEETASLYASERYIERFGFPSDPRNLSTHRFVGHGQDAVLIERLFGMGLDLGPENFLLSSENGSVNWRLVELGFGITIISDTVAEMTPGVIRLFPEIEPVKFPVWLTTHREIHTSRKIRLVFDILGEVLSEMGR